jgi:hypothetical protein
MPIICVYSKIGNKINEESWKDAISVVRVPAQVINAITQAEMLIKAELDALKEEGLDIVNG